MFDITPIQLAASFVSLAALLLFARALRGPRTQQWLGPAADWWELLRRRGLPLLDRLARRRLPGQHYAAYTLSLDVEGVPAEAEVVRGLEEQGSELDVRLGNRRSAGQAIDDIRRRVSAVAKRL